MVSRRTFMKTGIAGSVVLVASGWATKGVFWGARSRPAQVDGQKLEFLTIADAHALRAMAPSLLAGPFLEASPEVDAMLDAVVVGFDRAACGMLPTVQNEIRQLMALLTLPPARLLLGRRVRRWQDADQADIEAFINRLRNSSRDLFRSAYDALLQLTAASWYGNPQSWTSIGYDGPPQLA